MKKFLCYLLSLICVMSMLTGCGLEEAAGEVLGDIVMSELENFFANADVSTEEDGDGSFHISGSAIGEIDAEVGEEVAPGITYVGEVDTNRPTFDKLEEGWFAKFVEENGTSPFVHTMTEEEFDDSMKYILSATTISKDNSISQQEWESYCETSDIWQSLKDNGWVVLEPKLSVDVYEGQEIGTTIVPVVVMKHDSNICPIKLGHNQVEGLMNSLIETRSISLFNISHGMEMYVLIFKDNMNPHEFYVELDENSKYPLTANELCSIEDFQSFLNTAHSYDSQYCQMIVMNGVPYVVESEPYSRMSYSGVLEVEGNPMYTIGWRDSMSVEAVYDDTVMPDADSFNIYHDGKFSYNSYFVVSKSDDTSCKNQICLDVILHDYEILPESMLYNANIAAVTDYGEVLLTGPIIGQYSIFPKTANIVIDDVSSFDVEEYFYEMDK